MYVLIPIRNSFDGDLRSKIVVLGRPRTIWIRTNAYRKHQASAPQTGKIGEVRIAAIGLHSWLVSNLLAQTDYKQICVTKIRITRHNIAIQNILKHVLMVVTDGGNPTQTLAA